MTNTTRVEVTIRTLVEPDALAHELGVEPDYVARRGKVLVSDITTEHNVFISYVDSADPVDPSSALLTARAIIDGFDPREHVHTSVRVLFDGDVSGLVLEGRLVASLLERADAFEVDEVPAL